MGWADFLVKTLKETGQVIFNPRGNSMQGKIESGDKVVVITFPDIKYNVGDIVLCKVNGNQYLHLISAIDNNERAQISNNKNFVNGWIKINSIYGLCIQINDKIIHTKENLSKR